MTPEQSRKLRVGQRLTWQDNKTDQGTVTACDWSGVRVAWDNGTDQFVYHNDMEDLALAPSKS